MTSKREDEINSLENRTYYTDLEESLISSISLSIFCFFSAVTVYNDMDKFKNIATSKFVIIMLIFLSLSFATVGLVKYVTEFFNHLDEVYRYSFNYFQSIFYTFLVFILIVIELAFARNLIKTIYT